MFSSSRTILSIFASTTVLVSALQMDNGRKRLQKVSDKFRKGMTKTEQMRQLVEQRESRPVFQKAARDKRARARKTAIGRGLEVPDNEMQGVENVPQAPDSPADARDQLQRAQNGSGMDAAEMEFMCRLSNGGIDMDDVQSPGSPALSEASTATAPDENAVQRPDSVGVEPGRVVENHAAMNAPHFVPQAARAAQQEVEMPDAQAAPQADGAQPNQRYIPDGHHWVEGHVRINPSGERAAAANAPAGQVNGLRHYVVMNAPTRSPITVGTERGTMIQIAIYFGNSLVTTSYVFENSPEHDRTGGAYVLDSAIQ